MKQFLLGTAIANARDGVVHTTTASFAVMVSTFMQESFAHMVPWFIVTCAVILCDLITGVRKSYIMGEPVRISSAARRTMGKCVTYFSFVVMVCMICVASGAQYGIDKWSCLLVCAIEGISIMGNILRPKGYDFNFIAIMSLVFKKIFGGNKEDYKDIIEKEERK